MQLAYDRFPGRFIKWMGDHLSDGPTRQKEIADFIIYSTLANSYQLGGALNETEIAQLTAALQNVAKLKYVDDNGREQSLNCPSGIRGCPEGQPIISPFTEEDIQRAVRRAPNVLKALRQSTGHTFSEPWMAKAAAMAEALKVLANLPTRATDRKGSSYALVLRQTRSERNEATTEILPSSQANKFLTDRQLQGVSSRWSRYLEHLGLD